MNQKPRPPGEGWIQLKVATRNEILVQLKRFVNRRITIAHSGYSRVYHVRITAFKPTLDQPDSLDIIGEKVGDNGYFDDTFYGESWFRFIGNDIVEIDPLFNYMMRLSVFTAETPPWIELDIDTQAAVHARLTSWIGLRLTRTSMGITTELVLDTVDASMGQAGALILRGNIVTPVRGHHEEFLLVGTKLRFTTAEQIDIDDGISPMLGLKLADIL